MPDCLPLQPWWDGALAIAIPTKCMEQPISSDHKGMVIPSSHFGDCLLSKPSWEGRKASHSWLGTANIQLAVRGREGGLY